MATRNDFKVLAEVLKYEQPDLEKQLIKFQQWRLDIMAVANGLAQTNSGFNEKLFLVACGLTADLEAEYKKAAE